MTEWNRPVRHIPDDELHAYLDQALSRSQAVEIERHLARCPRCQAGRDAIAAMRDRTTDILACLGAPPIILPPPYADLVARHAATGTRRSSRVRRSILAAGLAGMLFAGHNSWPAGRGEAPVAAPTIATSAPAVDPPDSPVSTSVATPSQNSQPARHASRPARPASPQVESRQLVRRASRSEPPADGIASAVETDPGTWFAGVAAERAPLAESLSEESVVSVAPVGNQDPRLAGLWRTVTPDRAGPNAGVPLLPGAAILRMRMQPGDDGAEVVAVDQQLESGELIRTISGPARRVSALVNEDGGRDASGRVTVTIRQADRMVAVTGPSDVLGSLLSRVNDRRRY